MSCLREEKERKKSTHVKECVWEEREERARRN
jgi:hypothetical protein